MSRDLMWGQHPPGGKSPLSNSCAQFTQRCHPCQRWSETLWAGLGAEPELGRWPCCPSSGSPSTLVPGRGPCLEPSSVSPPHWACCPCQPEGGGSLQGPAGKPVSVAALVPRPSSTPRARGHILSCVSWVCRAQPGPSGTGRLTADEDLGEGGRLAVGVFHHDSVGGRVLSGAPEEERGKSP